jgi:protein-L-isoaspartate(D-aspartate) O-methyltransferase
MNHNTSFHEALSLSYRRRLVDVMRQQGTYLTPALQAAFLAIPRHSFLDHYYQQGEGFSWERIDAPPQDAALKAWQVWYEAIYQDEALVVQIDQRGRPLSSSSTPSVMAQMLESLEVSAGQTVLEIGTGTGYHAALLAHIVGVTDLVTTIEVNSTLASRAQQRLDEVLGKGIHVIIGDGLTWAGNARAFDRIIATGSFAHIPKTWIQALAVDGILVMEWRGAFTGALIQMHKQVDGRLSGRIVPGWNASFMPLHPPDAATAHSPLFTDQPIVERANVTGETFSPGLFIHPGLALWLQCAYPHLTLRRQYARDTNALTLYLIDVEHRTSLAMQEQESDNWTIVVYGSYPLWIQVSTIVQQWQALGRPMPDAYTLHVDDQGQMTLLLTSHHCQAMKDKLIKAP